MEGEKGPYTEAQMQMEKLKELKRVKDEKNRKLKSEAYRYIKETGKRIPGVKRNPRSIKIEKEVFEKIHRTVTALNKKEKAMKLSKAKFINMVLKEFMDSGADFSVVKSKAELKKMISKMRVEK